MPLPSGSRTSSTATSGCSAGIRAIASATEPASPMISRSGSEASRSHRPRRTTSWSSTRKTLTIASPFLSVSQLERFASDQPNIPYSRGEPSRSNGFNDFGPHELGPSADASAGGVSIALRQRPIAGATARTGREFPMTDEGVDILPVHECWELLGSLALGRLVTYADGQPDIFPVNYVVQRRTVLFRTAGERSWSAPRSTTGCSSKSTTTTSPRRGA